MSGMTGKKFKEIHGLDVVQALYRETGDWYHQLERFPAALCDRNGYVKYETRQEYLNDPYLQIGVEVTVPGGIAAHPRYKRVENSNLKKPATLEDFDL